MTKEAEAVMLSLADRRYMDVLRSVVHVDVEKSDAERVDEAATRRHKASGPTTSGDSAPSRATRDFVSNDENGRHAQTHRHTQTQTHTDTHTDTHRHTHTHTHTHTHLVAFALDFIACPHHFVAFRIAGGTASTRC